MLQFSVVFKLILGGSSFLHHTLQLAGTLVKPSANRRQNLNYSWLGLSRFSAFGAGTNTHFVLLLASFEQHSSIGWNTRETLSANRRQNFNYLWLGPSRFPALGAGYKYSLSASIGSFWNFLLYWLATVMTLVLVLKNSYEKRSKISEGSTDWNARTMSWHSSQRCKFTLKAHARTPQTKNEWNSKACAYTKTDDY